MLSLVLTIITSECKPPMLQYLQVFLFLFPSIIAIYAYRFHSALITNTPVLISFSPFGSFTLSSSHPWVCWQLPVPAQTPLFPSFSFFVSPPSADRLKISSLSRSCFSTHFLFQFLFLEGVLDVLRQECHKVCFHHFLFFYEYFSLLLVCLTLL